MQAVEAARKGKVITTALCSKANSATGDTWKDVLRRRRQFDCKAASLVDLPRSNNQHGGMRAKRQMELAADHAVAVAAYAAAADVAANAASA